jgi:hypothetical protein
MGEETPQSPSSLAAAAAMAANDSTMFASGNRLFGGAGSGSASSSRRPMSAASASANAGSLTDILFRMNAERFHDEVKHVPGASPASSQLA